MKLNEKTPREVTRRRQAKQARRRNRVARGRRNLHGLPSYKSCILIGADRFALFAARVKQELDYLALRREAEAKG
jgi:hypothetical protein